MAVIKRLRSYQTLWFRAILAKLQSRGWIIIFAAIFLYMIPWILTDILPNFTYEHLISTYTPVALIPTSLSYLLRGRRGLFMTLTINQSTFALILTIHYGLHWPQTIFVNWLIVNFYTYTAALFITHFAQLYKQTRHLNQELSTTHEALQEQHLMLLAVQEDLHIKNAELATANSWLESLATTDSLTGLLNHRAFVAALDSEIGRTRQSAQSCALLFFDLDHFKALNDGYGHPAGDVVLQQLAAIARQTLRDADVLGRWGGEEFIALLPETDSDDALAIAEHLRLAIADHLFAVGGGVHLTCAIGVSTFPCDAQERNDLVHAADQAMYMAKHMGRNQVRHCAERTVLVAALDNAATSRDEEAFIGTAEALTDLLSARDPYTGSHTNRVSGLTRDVALALGLSAQEAHMVELAGSLHDIGKVAIPDAILNKPSALSQDEWALMQTHPAIGAAIVNRIPFLRGICHIIRAHHERWDGTGYPDRLGGEAIPLGARIIAIVDAYDAMTTDRPYRQRSSSAAALLELRRCAGTQFDPTVLHAFTHVLVESIPSQPEKLAA